MSEKISSLLTPSAIRRLEFEKEKYGNDIARAAVSIALGDGRDNADEDEVNKALSLRKGRNLTFRIIFFHFISLLICCIPPGLLLLIFIYYIDQFILHTSSSSIIGLYSSSIAGGSTIGVAIYVYIIKPYLEYRYYK